MGFAGEKRRTARHLLVKMLMVSLSISGKQKITTAEVVKQFAKWMEIFLIIKINNKSSVACVAGAWYYYSF